MDQLTQLLNAVESGDPHAADRLLPLVYDELRRLAARKLAQERPGQTLEATALVHEAYLRLVGSGPGQPWHSRGHFCAAAAEAMRRILVENARRKATAKRGGGQRRVPFDQAQPVAEAPPEQLLALDEALAELEQHDAQAAPGEAALLRRFDPSAGGGATRHHAAGRGPAVGAGPGLAAPAAPGVVICSRPRRATAPLFSHEGVRNLVQGRRHNDPDTSNGSPPPPVSFRPEELRS